MYGAWPPTIQHKVFVSYHHADQQEVNSFINLFDRFHAIFISRALGVDIEQQLIDSTNTDYVMQRIRALYLVDSTVTLVLIGRCTWARRYVDWEIQSSLRRAADGRPPNGLLAVVLPSAGERPVPPDRLKHNLLGPN